MRKLVAILFLVPVLASAQTHTLPGTTNVPSGSTLNIQSGATINANAGSTITRFGTGGTPGGSNTQVQFNDSSVFGGDADFTWDKTNNVLNLGSGTPASSDLVRATKNTNGSVSIGIANNSAGAASQAGFI